MTLYEVLDVSPDCSPVEIEDAYRKRRGSGLPGWMARWLHPTADADYAYLILSNAQRRRHYDRSPDDFLEFHAVPIVI